MSFKAEDWDFIYTQRKNNNSYDLMVFNPNIKKLYFKEAIKEKYLNGTDSFGNPYHAQRLSPKTFDIIFNKLFNDYGCSEGFFYAETKVNIESKPEVDRSVEREYNIYMKESNCDSHLTMEFLSKKYGWMYTKT